MARNLDEQTDDISMSWSVEGWIQFCRIVKANPHKDPLSGSWIHFHPTVRNGQALINMTLGHECDCRFKGGPQIES